MFSYRKVHLLGKKANQRWYADMGLNIKTPEAAIHGKYIDKKCPFTSAVTTCVTSRSTDGRRRGGRTLMRSYEKRHRNIPAHCSPCFDVKEGDIVTIGQCR